MIDAADHTMPVRAPQTNRRAAKANVRRARRTKTTPKPPLAPKRIFSNAKVKPFNQIEWDRRTAEITDDAGKNLPWDGKTFGRLKVAGPAIAKAYFRVDTDILDDEGYFDTGDVATIDAHGYMRITDRSKDVIKSGGEWISSIEIENLAVGHPKVAEAAVIGVRHPKWDERPLLVVVLKKDVSATREEILAFLKGKIASWWMPDEIVFVDEIPHTATGKIQKMVLRERFKDFALPAAATAS
jgi:fatty-acyl-CoA synthase